MGRREPDRHTAYFDLLAACKQEGCPICTLTLAAVAHYLDAIIYESVNDPPTRMELVAAAGYCNEHSWQLRHMGAALGAAIMYRDVLRRAAEALDRGPGRDGLQLFPGRLRARWPRRWLPGRTRAGSQDLADPHTSCPACLMREHAELLYLGVLLEHIGETEATAAFRVSAGLCLVHLDRTVAIAGKRAALGRLLDLEGELLRALDEDLSEFARKHDYRYQGEKIGAEGDAWIRAIGAVAGKPGIR
jgi:hypothetical protein